MVSRLQRSGAVAFSAAAPFPSSSLESLPFHSYDAANPPAIAAAAAAPNAKLNTLGSVNASHDERKVEGSVKSSSYIPRDSRQKSSVTQGDSDAAPHAHASQTTNKKQQDNRHSNESISDDTYTLPDPAYPSSSTRIESSNANCKVDCEIPYEIESGGVPVFRPNWEQFKDFAKFIQTVNEVGAYYGILKVIPPSEYHPNRSSFHEIPLQEKLIQNPVRQEVRGVIGLPGAFQVYAVDDVDHKTVTVPEFVGLAMSAESNRNKRERALVDNGEWEELERKFWSQTLGSPALYGADSPGTLFDSTDVWNVGNLPSLLHVLGAPIAGVSLPFLYWGQWRSSFAWHQEDMNLYSINYLHYGLPKQWYAIKPSDSNRFDRALHNIWPQNVQNCPAFLRHKSSVVSTKVLHARGVPFMKTRQHRGEFIVLWPACYHQGFNYGLNCAESVNFATNYWLESFSRSVSRCICRQDTVWLSADELRERLRKLQYLYRQEQRRLKSTKGTSSTSCSSSSSSPPSSSSASSPSDIQKEGSNAASESNDSSPPSLSVTDDELSVSSVPKDYQLNDSSIWLDLPTNPVLLSELKERYYHDEQLKATQGRSMAGRSMHAQSSQQDDDAIADYSNGSTSANRVFNEQSYNNFDTNYSDHSEGHIREAGVFCTYPDCPQPLFKNQNALVKHYASYHTAAAAEKRAQQAALQAAQSAAAAGGPPPLHHPYNAIAELQRLPATIPMELSTSAAIIQPKKRKLEESNNVPITDNTAMTITPAFTPSTPTALTFDQAATDPAFKKQNIHP